MANVDLIVKSKIKEAVPELNVASDVPEALNKKALELLKEAAERAKANGRRTLQGRDL
ncbi:MAG: NFYB/HAP3 family transcription factor subunit [Nanoarchaeota archaeon]|nr:NFYB/HAP3 family transcription factor subunit [Nanoarchaeota archaeon]